MKQRNPGLVLMLSMFTFGIYALVWLVKSKEEMNTLGAQIPTAWLMLIPVVGGPLFLWKFSKGVEQVTGGSMGAGLTFALFLFLGPVGFVLTQINFNKLGQSGNGYPVSA